MREDTGTRGFRAAEALAIHRLVKLNGSTAESIVYADAGDAAIGSTVKAVANAGLVGVWLLASKPGTLTCIAAGAITVNALVYTANDGKVSSSATGEPVGRALKATTADGDLLEVLPIATTDQLGSAASIFEVFDDFHIYTTVSTGPFATTATDSGTITVADGGVGGVALVAASDGSVADNDESYLHQAFETFLFANAKPLWFECRVALTEANTDDANVAVGVKDAWAADSILDDGAGPSASYSGALFFKVDGGTVWQAECSIAGTQTTVTLTGASFPGDGTYQRMGIEFIPTSSTIATVNFYIDGVLVGSTAAFTYTSATHMEAGVGVKNGDTNAEILNVDYIRCSQVR